mgnify:CR=1 FL=1
MSLNTAHKVTLTEGQIGVILCSLEDSIKKSEHYIEAVSYTHLTLPTKA